MKNSRTAGRTSAVDQRWLWAGINSLCRACSPLFQLLLSAGPSFNASSTVETKSVWMKLIDYETWKGSRKFGRNRVPISYRDSRYYIRLQIDSAIFSNDLRSAGNSLTILIIIFLSIHIIQFIQSEIYYTIRNFLILNINNYY